MRSAKSYGQYVFAYRNEGPGGLGHGTAVIVRLFQNYFLYEPTFGLVRFLAKYAVSMDTVRYATATPISARSTIIVLRRTALLES